MDGAKSVTDTTDIRKDSGRQAFFLDRSFSVRIGGPKRNENPGNSRIYTEWEPLIPKGQGFLSNVNQLRVS